MEKQWGLWLKVDDPWRWNLVIGGTTTWKGSSKEEQEGDGSYNNMGSPDKESSNTHGNPKGKNHCWARGKEGQGDSDSILGGDLTRSTARGFSAKSASVEGCNVHAKLPNYGKVGAVVERDPLGTKRAMSTSISSETHSANTMKQPGLKWRAVLLSLYLQMVATQNSWTVQF
jgi:hypothetical protein